VLSILPLLRTFSEAIHLHAIWVEHRPQYEHLVSLVHEPLTAMVLNTNIYLHLAVSSYDGRRFLVLLEPMLSPLATNARYDASESVVVVSPAREPEGKVPMDLIRHTYLHYTVEPLVYARAAAMDRLLPLLKPVQSAPLDFTYKSDIVALLTECLIKAIEARTMDVGIQKPTRPSVVHDRADLERYQADMTLYDRKAEAVRRQTVARDMTQGWVLVDYFYGQLGQMEHDSISLKDNIGPMIYGMDVDNERHKDEHIAFVAQPSGSDVVRRTPRQLTGLDLAEMKLLKGDKDGAEEIADSALADPNGDHAAAHYLLARIDLMDGQPEDAVTHFTETLRISRDPRTLAWAHIYLGRLYDTKPDRPKALDEYREALTVRDDRPDTKAAAEQGLKAPFALPKRTAASSDLEDDTPLDPSGKAEKESYRPTPPQ
jgi:tetratricopeptide (TPR) repeat protein